MQPDDKRSESLNVNLCMAFIVFYLHLYDQISIYRCILDQKGKYFTWYGGKILPKY